MAEGEAAALVIAHEIVAMLEQHGLHPHWNGEWSRAALTASGHDQSLSRNEVRGAGLRA